MKFGQKIFGYKEGIHKNWTFPFTGIFLFAAEPDGAPW
jgi:hypothetical protein